MADKTKLLEILLVEDNNENLERARKIANRLPEAGILVRVDYASDLREALEYVSKNKYNGIISDVFYPSNLENDSAIRQELAVLLLEVNEKGEDRTKGSIPSIYEWRDGLSEAPMGVYLSEHVSAEIPLVFCSSMYHHSTKLEPVCLYANTNERRLGGKGIPDTRIILVDCGKKGNKTGNKNWGNAFATLNYLITQKDEGVSKSYNLTKIWDETS